MNILLTPSPSSQQILKYYSRQKLTPDQKEYLRDHAIRFEFLLKKVEAIVKGQQIKKILDIGISFETDILRLTYPEIQIDSLGFADNRYKLRPEDKHINYNLNNSRDKQKWPKLKDYDLVILAEVIEHLPISPKLVLQCISSGLNPKGYLIIQTPNAVSLKRRLKMVAGSNPFEMIREEPLNPGHFREYTVAELISISKECGLILKGYSFQNYYRHSGNLGKIYNFVCRLLPGSFSDGLFLCFAKRE